MKSCIDFKSSYSLLFAPSLSLSLILIYFLHFCSKLQHLVNFELSLCASNYFFQTVSKTVAAIANKTEMLVK